MKRYLVLWLAALLALSSARDIPAATAGTPSEAAAAESSGPESSAAPALSDDPSGLLSADEEADSEETMPPAVTDDAGCYQVWDVGETVYSWIPVPSGMVVDEEWTNLYALTIDSGDTDSLDAEAEYYVYNADEGYQDFNMDDPLEIEASYIAEDDDLSYNGPSEIESFTAEEKEYMGSSLLVAYIPQDGSPVYTTEYLIWNRPDERTIVTVLVHIRSANPEPALSMEDAAGMFLSQIPQGGS